MEIPVGAMLSQFENFILVFVRMTGLFVIAPIFGRRNVPAYLKIGFALFMSYILINTMAFQKLEYYNSFYQYAFLVAKEFIVGITIGYVSFVVFSAVYLAGQLMDMQIGFGMVNVIDPVSNIQAPVTSNFYFILAMLVFMSLDGHLILIKSLFDSFKVIPPGGAFFNSNLMNDIIRIFGNIFVIGFKISAPVIAAILISDLVLGVISRTIPQFNVFVVGMPFKIIIGIFVMVFTIPAFITLMKVLLGDMNNETLNFIKHMGQR